MLICSGDRDSFQLVDDHIDRALPDARGLRDDADDPRGGRGALRRPPESLPGPRRDGRRDLRQPARRARRRARASRRSGSTSTTASTASSRTPTRSPARRASRCASTSATCCATAAQRVGARPRAAAAPDRPGACSPGTATRCTRSSTASSSGCCATACSRRCRPTSPTSPPAPPSTAPSSRPVSFAGWLAEHASGESLTGVEVAGTVGRRHRPAHVGRAGRRRAGGSCVDRRRRDQRRRRDGAGRVARRPGPAQGAARREGPDARAGRAGLAAARARRRHRSVGLPLAPRPALLRPGRPHAALPAPRAEERGGVHRPAVASTSTATPRSRRSRCSKANAVVDLAAALETELDDARRLQPARRRRAAAGRRAREDGAGRHRGRHRPPHRRSRRSSPAGSSRLPTTPTT